MESKGTFFILIIVVAVLTLALAAPAGYLFLVQGTPGAKETESHSAEVKEVPKEDELTKIELYEGNKKYFNLKSDDPDKIAIIQVDIAFKYFTEIKDDKKIKVPEKIEFYLVDIKELVSTYFMNVTLEDVRLKDARDKAKEELKKQINELLNQGEKEIHEYVYSVLISEWLYQ